ncbi:uncharacterized protein Dwil_GK14716 [Drosophila willistoni]|uniref:RAP domain-containing protein n=1 Tax=Drosophila willistoni TaxID=7260 RepID=B4MUY3_DROWI|nr:uncharacterized protein LOC6642315 [Drosophila willistoni]EDW76328.1 uncharacterized protein Dwil_GK14716 [Drosophila willistoni]
MYLSYLSRGQWKCLQYLLQIHRLQLMRRHVHLGAGRQTQQKENLPAAFLPRRFYQEQKANEDSLLQRLQHDSVIIELPQLINGLPNLWVQYQNMDETNKLDLRTKVVRNILPFLDKDDLINHMTVDDLSCCYLYLRKIHIPNSNLTVERILTQGLRLIEDSVHGNLIPLTSLSRFAVGINLERDFFTPLVCRNFMPHLDRHIHQCQTEEQVRLLATCLFQLHPLIDQDSLQTYKEKVQKLIQDKTLSEFTPKALIKVLHMLNLPVWSQQHTPLRRKIMLTLIPCLGELEANDLKSVCRTFLHHQEPAELVGPLKAATEKILKDELTPDNLSCAVPFAMPQQRDNYLMQFKTLLYSNDSWSLPNTSGFLFTILRALKISDLQQCNTYWSLVIKELDSSLEEQTHLRFLRHCQRYMNFNNNLGGTYRHHDVERKLSRMCMEVIDGGDIAGRLPSKFARMASFVLAYGQTPFAWKKFPNILLSKMLTMAQQFDIQDCFLLSRGMQIACELRFRHNVPPLMTMQLTTMDSILIGCAERHLEEPTLKASDLSVIVRTLSHRKTLKNTQVYNEALALYKTLNCNDLSSRVVRDMAYNFNASHFFVPEMLDSMFDYIAQQHQHITGDTVEKVLTCSYNLGYTPNSLEALERAGNILLRDFDHMSGLSLIQASLALCFYKTIPEQLINQVFCVKFIQRIEDEIQICYSKATYPERVLNQVMQLNRTVCLDMPEANVPWFQQNYIEAQLSKKPVQTSIFGREVQQLLQDVLKDDKYFRCNHTTPYGYQIDFVIHFDKDKKLLPATPVESTMLDRITKVAILLLKLDSFCENDLTALRGPESLKIKHLEMMGYKVLHINEHDWNSKYMKARGAKTNYLKCLLQISH